MNSQILRIQITLAVVMLAGLVLAAVFGDYVANENVAQLSFLFSGCCLLVWAIIGQKVWWLPIFFFVYLGGFFYVGFKIYSHELAVLICLLPLILALAMKSDELKGRHFGIPLPVFVLFIYLCLHFLVCAAGNELEGTGGLGNIARRYMDAIWPFLVFLPFLLVGNTKYTPWVLHLLAGATLLRFGFGTYSAIKGTDSEGLFIPGLTFYPAGGASAQDLRVSGSALVTVALCYFCIYRSFLLKMALIPVIAAGMWGTFLGGGRITIVVLFGLFGFLFLIYKKYGLLLILTVSFLVGAIAINTSPYSLYSLPDSVRRATSAFIIDRRLAADIADARASDEWHERLMKEGWNSWTDNALTILFGRGVKPFDENAWMNGENFEGMIDMAIQTSRFEKGLWDVLCTFGLVGLVLYSALLWKIISHCTPILFREKIKTPVHAIMFIAVYQCVTWFLLCWIYDSFPSGQLLIGIVAMVAVHDMKRARNLQTQMAEVSDASGMSDRRRIHY